MRNGRESGIYVTEYPKGVADEKLPWVRYILLLEISGGIRTRFSKPPAGPPAREPIWWSSPELCVCGYPPMDLLDYNDFIDRNIESLRYLSGHPARGCDGSPGLCGLKTIGKGGRALAQRRSGDLGGRRSYIHSTRPSLPTYDIFDEARYFEPGEEWKTFECAGRSVGIAVCEDIWWGKRGTAHAERSISGKGAPSGRRGSFNRALGVSLFRGKICNPAVDSDGHRPAPPGCLWSTSTWSAETTRLYSTVILSSSHPKVPQLTQLVSGRTLSSSNPSRKP